MISIPVNTEIAFVNNHSHGLLFEEPHLFKVLLYHVLSYLCIPTLTHCLTRLQQHTTFTFHQELKQYL